jgi:hypothetical protein
MLHSDCILIAVSHLMSTRSCVVILRWHLFPDGQFLFVVKFIGKVLLVFIFSAIIGKLFKLDKIERD